MDKNSDFALVGEGTLNIFLVLYVSFLLILVTNNGLFRGSLRYSCPHLREPFLQRHLKGLCQTHPSPPPLTKTLEIVLKVLLKITLTSYYCTSNIIEPSTVFLTFDMGQLQKKKNLPNLKEIHLKRTKI